MCDLKSIQHIKSLPFVKISLDYINNAYDKIKNSNKIVGLSLQSAEETLRIGIDLSQPTLILFDVPLHVIDNLVDYTLYAVEEKFPIIKSKPEEVVKTAKKYTYAVGQKIELAKLVALCETGYYVDLASSYLDVPVKSSLKFITNLQPTPPTSTSYTRHRTGTLENIIFSNLCKTNTLLQINSYVTNNIETLKTIQEHNSCLILLHVQHLNDITDSEVIYPKAQQLFRDVLKLMFKLQKVLLGRALLEITEIYHLQVHVFSHLYHLTILCLLRPDKFVIKIKEIWAEYSSNQPEVVEKAENLAELVQILMKHGIRHIVHFTNAIAIKINHIPEYALQFFTFALQILGSFLQILDFQNENLRHIVVISKEYLTYILHKFLHSVTEQFLSLESEGSKTASSSTKENIQETTETSCCCKRVKKHVAFYSDDETDTGEENLSEEIITETIVQPEGTEIVEDKSAEGSKSIIMKKVTVTTTTTTSDNAGSFEGEFSDAHTETKVSEEFIELEDGQIDSSKKESSL